MREERAAQPPVARATGSASSASCTPGPLRLVVGLTLVGALLPFSGLPHEPIYVVATASLTGLHTWGFFRYRPQPRWLWRLVAACLWVLVLGDFMAVALGPTAGETVLAVGYILGIVAAGALVRLRGEQDPGALLDALLVTAVVGAVLWHVSVAPATEPGVGVRMLLLRIVISLMHLVGLFLVARLLTSGRVPVGLWLFTAGFALTVITDIATTTTGRSFLEPTWVAIIIVSRGAFAALTLAPATRQLVPRRHLAGRGPALRHRMLAFTAALGFVVVPVLVGIGLEGRIELAAYVVLVPFAAAALGIRVWRVIGEHERAHERLLHEAEHDPLTGLANRRSLTRHMEETLDTAEGPGLAVLYCDLDGFKQVNDRLGHAAGDECLRIVSRRLAGTLRPGDLLGRFGGDEFVMSCRDVSTEDEAESIARRVVEAVSQPLVVEDTEVTLTVSVGVRIGKPGVAAERLITDADAAMYTAKQSSGAPGRGPAVHRAGRSAGIAVHDPLGDAISGDELRLHVQPICRLDTGRLANVEALVRWQHPARGLLGPDEFVPLAERTGLIDALGRWTLLATCRWLAEERSRGLPDDVAASVNVSTRQLGSERLHADLVEALEDTGVPPDLICLEITESELFADRDAAIGAVEQLRGLGVRLAIDDFGAGYSSLAALSWLPIDTIKLDRSFTTSLHAVGRERAVARAAVMLGRELGLTVVAEGVETLRQWDLLCELGCHEGQGFLIGHPGPSLQVEPPGWIPEVTSGRVAGHQRL